MRVFKSLVIAVAIFSVGCASLVPGNPNSNQRSKEIVRISVVKKPAVKAAAVAAVAIPIIVDFAVKRTVAELEKEADRYTASWSGFTVQDGFYNVVNGRPADVAVESIKVERFVGGDTTSPVFTAKLNIKPSADGFAFQLIPNTLKLKKSKAKLRSNDDDLDLDMEIRIEALFSHNEKVQLIEIGSLNIPFRGIKLDKEWTNENDAVKSQWFPAVPVSRSADGKNLGTGNYVVKVMVREYDDFGEKVKRVAEYLDANKENITEYVTSND